MARIRTIKPSFWAHEELSALPESTHMLAGSLLNYSDDFGYFNANIGLIRAACTPLREPSVSIPESLRSLQAMGYIRVGVAPDGKRYGHVVHFDEHQKVSHPTESKIAKLPIAWETFSNVPENIVKPPEPLRPEGNKEGKGIRNKDSASQTPVASSTPDLKSELFGHCLVWLVAASDKTPEKLRPMIGKWIKDRGEGAVLQAFVHAQQSRPVDPVSWITAALRTGKPNGKQRDDSVSRTNALAGAFADIIGGSTSGPGADQPEGPGGDAERNPGPVAAAGRVRHDGEILSGSPAGCAAGSGRESPPPDSLDEQILSQASGDSRRHPVGPGGPTQATLGAGARGARMEATGTSDICRGKAETWTDVRGPVEEIEIDRRGPIGFDVRKP